MNGFQVTSFFILILVIALGGVGALIWNVHLSPRARRRRRLRQYKGVRIAQAQDGALVKLVGRVHAAEDHTPLSAPLSGREGVHYAVVVEQRRQSGDVSHWREIVSERETLPQIWIEGGAAGERALVELAAADVELVMDGKWTSGFLNDAPPKLKDFLARHGEDSTGIVFNKNLRYREGVIELGERVAVLGRCVREPDPDPRAEGVEGFEGGYRSHPTRLRIVATAEQPVIVTDDPKLFR